MPPSAVLRSNDRPNQSQSLRACPTLVLFPFHACAAAAPACPAHAPAGAQVRHSVYLPAATHIGA